MESTRGAENRGSQGALCVVAAAVHGSVVWMVFTLIARTRKDIGEDAFDVPGWGLSGRGSMLVVALVLGYLAGKWWVLVAPAMNIPQMALLPLGTEPGSGLWIIGELIIVWYMLTNLAAAAVGARLGASRRARTASKGPSSRPV